MEFTLKQKLFVGWGLAAFFGCSWGLQGGYSALFIRFILPMPIWGLMFTFVLE